MKSVSGLHQPTDERIRVKCVFCSLKSKLLPPDVWIQFTLKWSLNGGISNECPPHLYAASKIGCCYCWGCLGRRRRHFFFYWPFRLKRPLNSTKAARQKNIHTNWQSIDNDGPSNQSSRSSWWSCFVIQNGLLGEKEGKHTNTHTHTLMSDIGGVET